MVLLRSESAPQLDCRKTLRFVMLDICSSCDQPTLDQSEQKLGSVYVNALTLVEKALGRCDQRF